MIKKIFAISNLLLIAIAIFFGVNIFYLFVEMTLCDPDRGMPEARPAKSVQTRSGAANKNLLYSGDYDAIGERDLFHTKRKYGRGESSGTIDLEKLKLTDLNLKLWGTVSTGDWQSEIARAVIEDPDERTQLLYKVGDSVQHALIMEIHRNSVVLDIRGTKEKLTMEEKLAGRKVSIRSPENLQIPVDKTVESQRKIVMKPREIERSQIDNALGDISHLIKDVKIRPYYNDGETAGLVVANITPESIVRDLGIKSGDILESVNGQQIKSADDAMAIYDNLKAGDKLTIRLIRRGRPHVIEYTVKDEMSGLQQVKNGK